MKRSKTGMLMMEMYISIISNYLCYLFTLRKPLSSLVFICSYFISLYACSGNCIRCASIYIMVSHTDNCDSWLDASTANLVVEHFVTMPTCFSTKFTVPIFVVYNV